MTLRAKILVAVALTFFLMAGLMSIMINRIILGSFERLEVQKVKTNVTRVQHAFREELAAMDSTGGDWAAWNETRDFVLGQNATYPVDNLSDASQENLRLNFMIYLDNAGEVVYAKAVDLQAEAEIPVTESLLAQLRGMATHLKPENPHDSKTGFLQLPDGPALVAFWPISNNEYEEPISGTLIIGRYLNDREMDRMAERTQLSLELLPANDLVLADDYRQAQAELAAGQAIAVVPLGGDRIAGYARIADIQGNAAFLMRVDVPRDILQHGASSTRYFRMTLVLVGAAVLLVLLFAIERTILKPVTELIDSVAHVAKAQDLSMRLPSRTKDELGKLTDAVNQMLHALESAVEERRRIEVKLQQAEKAESLNMMAGSIAHNFNNLLHTVLGYHELLLEDLAVQSEIKKAVEEANKAAQRAAELSTLMLTYVGQTRRAHKAINLLEVVTAAKASREAALPDRISCRYELAQELPPVLGDPAQVDQVLSSLFSNAVEAIGDGSGSITVATGVVECRLEDLQQSASFDDQIPGRYVYLEVRDSGCGMDDETRRRIFDPYFTTKFAGRGMGLATVLGIVRSHRGAITVDSSPGKGATIRVLFPAMPD